jgi:stage V sporulation protein B
VYVVIVVIASGAIPTAVSKLVSERIALGQYRNAHGIFKTTMTFATAIGVVAALGLWFGARPLAGLLNSPESFYAMRALAPSLVVLGAVGAFRGYFQGMKSMLPVALSQLADQIFNVAFSLWLAYILLDAARMHRSVAGAAAGSSIGAAAGLLVLIGLYMLVQKDFKQRMLKDLEPPYEAERKQLKALVLTSLPILIGLGLYAVGTPIDQGMANARIAFSGAFSTEEVNVLVGQFGGKFLLLTSLPVALATALSVAVIPEISASRSLNDGKSVRQNINTALRFAMIISIPSAVGLAVLANPVIRLLFPSHPEGGWMLQWGAVSVVLMALNQIMTGSLQGVGKISMPVIAALFGILVKIPINWFLMAVPGINILGAVISTILCYVVASGLNIFFLYKSTGILPDFAAAFIRPAAAAAAMGLSCFGLHRGLSVIMPAFFATTFAMLLGVGIYIAVMYMIGGLKPGDLALFPLPGWMKRWMRG